MKFLLNPRLAGAGSFVCERFLKAVCVGVSFTFSWDPNRRRDVEWRLSKEISFYFLTLYRR